jgi:hypothetical protein
MLGLRFKLFFFAVGLLIGALAGKAFAMPMKTQVVRPRAFLQPAGGGLMEALDLKAKTLYFTKKEFDQCGAKLVRKARTMTYSCTLPIASRSKISKLHNVLTPKSIEIPFGGTQREVQVEVADDARSVTFTTGFDSTGVDFEMSKFNDDFFKVYDQVAVLVISDALKKNVKIEVLESR